MITNRYIDEKDKETIGQSLLVDEFHQGTDAAFFYEPGTVSSVYEDERGPIFVMKGTPTVRLDIQFLDNSDFKRNREALEEAHKTFVKNAKDSGFKELVFCSNSPLLRAFCKRKFGFKEVDGELRKFL